MLKEEIEWNARMDELQRPVISNCEFITNDTTVRGAPIIPGSIHIGQCYEPMTTTSIDKDYLASAIAEELGKQENPPCETYPKIPVAWALGILGALLLLMLAVAYFTASPTLYTEYSAVRMTNGDTYYGKLKGLGSKFPVMTEVFTIGENVDPLKGTMGSIMRPRANEFHAPARTILNSEQILFVESVAAASQVGQLINKMPREGKR